MGIKSGVTHLLELDAFVTALAKVGAGVKGRESVSVYLKKKFRHAFLQDKVISTFEIILLVHFPLAVGYSVVPV